MDTVYNVYLRSINDVKKFASISNQYDGEVLVSTGMYTVSGKSLLGLFSLDLSKPLTVVFSGSSPEDIIGEIISEIGMQRG